MVKALPGEQNAQNSQNERYGGATISFGKMNLKSKTRGERFTRRSSAIVTAGHCAA
jgi:hypothetical protein